MTASPPTGPDRSAQDALEHAVDEVEEFVGTGGWDAPRQMFALVRTAELLSAEPGLAGQVTGTAKSGIDEFTPIAQDSLPGDTVADALATITWPDEVAGCVLVMEILAGAGEDQREARLAAGVLRDRPGGACLLRWRHAPDGPLLRGADLAPGLLAALQGTFEL
jgi:hypothetical protein